jgi:hypothetical protein
VRRAAEEQAGGDGDSGGGGGGCGGRHWSVGGGEVYIDLALPAVRLGRLVCVSRSGYGSTTRYAHAGCRPHVTDRWSQEWCGTTCRRGVGFAFAFRAQQDGVCVFCFFRTDCNCLGEEIAWRPRSSGWMD